MPSFRYMALSTAGAVITGEMEGASEAAVIEHLQDLGHYPISATAGSGAGWRGWLTRDLLRPRRPSARDLAIATHELATLLRAGLPLDRALEILGGLAEVGRLRPHLAAVLGRVRNGATLADAFAASRNTFPRLYISMVRAGELGGNLDATLSRLADYLAKAHAIREAITSALIYPAILVTTAGLAITVILVFVLPQFEPLFRDAGKALPLATQIVMTIGNFIGAYWWLLLLSGAGLVVAARRALRRPGLRYRWDLLLLRLPLIGSLVGKIQTERFSRTLGTLLRNGVSLPVGLGIARDTLGNSVFEKAVTSTAATLREGESLAALMGRAKVFAALALDFVRVGEETGRLEEMLLHQADICEREIKHTVERLLALLVPAITIFLGAVVAGLIASMMLAILSVNDLALR